MITENKTIKVSSKYTLEAKKEISAPSKKTCNKLILGSLGAAVGFVLLIFVFYYFEKTDLAGLMFGFFVFSLLVLLFGAGLKYSIKKDLQKPIPPTVFEYEFFDGGIAAKEEVNGEVVHASKYYNKNIGKTLEGKRYLFLYVDSSHALVIDKNELSPAELSTLKWIYFKQYSSERLELAEFEPGTPDFVKATETPKEELPLD
ncbi:MAG: hypothetical protein HDT28_09380 [Clostridiales bacterium]|nr:hypothetical protein [Clostridiales bacterium]